jgi:hypothetical protein
MKKIFFITTILFSVQSLAQNVITSDNKRLDSLTSSFKTYSVILIVNDSVSEHAVKSNIVAELQRNYPFLKKKKLRSGEADFSIQININGQAIGLLDHKVTPRDDRYVTHYNHEYSLNHLTSIGFVVNSKGTDLIAISFGTDVVVQRHYNYTETIADTKWLPDRSKTTAVEISYLQRNIKGKQGLSEIWRFEKDFFEPFNNYKSLKL